MVFYKHPSSTSRSWRWTATGQMWPKSCATGALLDTSWPLYRTADGTSRPTYPSHCCRLHYWTPASTFLAKPWVLSSDNKCIYGLPKNDVNNLKSYPSKSIKKMRIRLFLKTLNWEETEWFWVTANLLSCKILNLNKRNNIHSSCTSVKTKFNNYYTYYTLLYLTTHSRLQIGKIKLYLHTGT